MKIDISNENALAGKEQKQKALTHFQYKFDGICPLAVSPWPNIVLPVYENYKNANEYAATGILVQYSQQKSRRMSKDCLCNFI